jgi:hypothetical protein
MALIVIAMKIVKNYHFLSLFGGVSVKKVNAISICVGNVSTLIEVRS